MISLPQPVVRHSSFDEPAGSNSFSSMQIGPMCRSKFKLLSKCKRATSLSKLVGWYAGCIVILTTRFVWNGFGSSVLPNFHSPALIKISCVRKLVGKIWIWNSFDISFDDIDFDFDCDITYPCTQCAAVATRFPSMMAPPHKIDFVDSVNILDIDRIGKLNWILDV